MEPDKLMHAAKELFMPQLLFFNLFFVYMGMLVAQNYSLGTAILLTVAFVSARSSGVLMNRYVGRGEDLADPTKIKSMCSLKVPKNVLLILFVVFAAVFMLGAYLLNTLSFILAPLPLAFFVIDPMVKRHTSKRHYFLGLIESFDVAGGYIGASGIFPSSILVYILMFAVIFIGGGFDILISMRKAAFDAGHGLKTIPSTRGIPAALNYSLYSHITAAAFLVLFAIVSGSYIILAGAVLASAILLMQHIDIDPNDGPGTMSRVARYNTAAALVLLLSLLISVFGA